MRDRNDRAEFALDFNNEIVLGTPKQLHLLVQVQVEGEEFRILPKTCVS